jgi:hypothetical protein
VYAAAFESRKAGVTVKVFGVGCRSVLSQLYNDGILCCTILIMPQSQSKHCCVELDVVSPEGQTIPRLDSEARYHSCQWYLHRCGAHVYVRVVAGYSGRVFLTAALASFSRGEISSSNLTSASPLLI